MQSTPSRTPAPDAPPFRIRRARRGDAESLATLLRELGYAHGSDAQTVHWVISHPEIEIFVAADPQDRPVGMVSLSHRPQLRLRGRIATVDELVVTETWRCRGVGKALMEHVLDRCGERALSVKRVEVSAYALEELASFFEARGFVRVDNMVMRYEKLEGQHR